MPSDLFRDFWETFSTFIFNRMNTVSTLQMVALLLDVESLQILMCVPILHITQILIGYSIGITGLLGSVMWEISFLTLYVLVFKNKVIDKNMVLLAYI